MDRKRKVSASDRGRGSSSGGRGRGGSTSGRSGTPGRGRGTSRGGASAGASSSSSGFRTPSSSGRGQSSGKQQPGSQPRYGRGGSAYRTPGSSADTRYGGRSRPGGFAAASSPANAVPAGFPVLSFSPAQPSHMASSAHKGITLDKEKEGYIWKVRETCEHSFPPQLSCAGCCQDEAVASQGMHNKSKGMHIW